jgi:predicted AlkP superfamily phosphohydrolase/phosphomutase
MREHVPLVMIGLDAVDGFEVRRLVGAGGLPNLGKLMRRGQFRQLYNEAPGLIGSVWRSFINGLPVGEHGWYYRKIWRPDLGRVEMAAPSWLRLEPFWQHLCGGPYRLAIIDVPCAPSGAAARLSRHLSQRLQCHDQAPPASTPQELWRELEVRFGRPRLMAERYGRQTEASLLQLRAQAIDAAGQIGEIAAWLLGREHCDLLLVVLGAGHRAGHYLWDTSQIDETARGPQDRDLPAAALDEVYAACDRAVGRIVGAAPSGSRIAAFALHGMGPNPGWTDNRFSDILALLHGDQTRRRASVSLRGQIRRAVRSPMVMRATRLMPGALHRRFGRVWSARMFDWKRTRFFDLPADVCGYVRINLRGREPEGTVRQGAPFDALCEELAEELLSLEDLETGESIVAAVDRIDQMVAPDTPFRHVLPDLAVHWAGRPLGSSIGVRSLRHGELVWERGEKLASGRSGNHRPEGWLVTAGPRIMPGAAPAASTLDLVPAIFHVLGAPPPPEIASWPFEPLLGEPAGAGRTSPGAQPGGQQRRKVRAADDSQHAEQRQIDQARCN